MLKRAIVVGASSGIGEALVRRLVAGGYRVAAVARREDRLRQLAVRTEVNGEGRVIPIVHDVHDLADTSRAFREAVVALDGLDLIVYAAGVMPRVGPEQFDTTLDADIFAVNTTGAIAWLNLAAERFQALRGGVIVGIGSVAGERGRVGSPAYCASKAALHTWLESARNRLSRHGVHVLTVKPGPVHTEMTAGLDKLPMAIQADDAANRIFGAIARRDQVAYVPFQWALIMAVIRLIPSILFRRTSI